MASRRTLHPGQRALAIDPVDLLEAPNRLLEASNELGEAVIGPLVGQLEIFPRPASTVTPLQRHPSTSQVGDWGEEYFAGVCRAAGIECLRQQPGNEGFDFMACGWRVEVKATETLTKDGRLNFSAGGHRRFSNYAGRTDFFAFVTLGPGIDLYGRVLILPIDAVLRRWQGGGAMLRPIELPSKPDLSLLGGSSLAATASAENVRGGGELVAVRVR